MEPHWNFEDAFEGGSVGHYALQAAVFGLFAGVSAIVVSLLIEKCGGIIGGVLGTLPSTIIPASLGVAIFATHMNKGGIESSDYWYQHQDEDAFWTRTSQAENVILTMYSVPSGLLLDVLFLLFWRELPRFLERIPFKLVSIAILTVLSLSFWAVGAVGLVYLLRFFLRLSVSIRVIGIVSLLLHALLGVVVVMVRKVDAPKAKRTMNPGVYLLRGVFAAVVVGVAIFVSYFNPVAGGITSVFPAIFLTTMVFLWWDHDQSLCVGAAGPMMMGSLSVGAYACFFAEIFAWLFVDQYNDRVTSAVLAAIASDLIVIAAIALPVVGFLQWNRHTPSESH